jgi:hypothetical protein
MNFFFFVKNELELIFFSFLFIFYVPRNMIVTFSRNMQAVVRNETSTPVLIAS